MYPVFRQILRFQQGFRHFLIAVIPAALTDILHIATFENALNNKIGFGIIVNLFKVHIPKNAFFEYGFLFLHHTTKLIDYLIISSISSGVIGILSPIISLPVSVTKIPSSRRIPPKSRYSVKRSKLIKPVFIFSAFHFSI